jgi:multidrug efflux pump subunit AcrA (membrane-fusion protein)
MKESPVPSISEDRPDHQLSAGKEPKLLESGKQEQSTGAAENRGQAPRRLWWIAFGVAAVLLALLLFGFLRRHQQQKVVEAAAREEQQALPVVNVTRVLRSPAATSELLPGNMTPLTEAYIYARSSGYVKKRYVDIGDHVKQGQLLAEVEAPDLDQQVQQGRAALSQAEHQVVQAKAEYDNAKSQEDLAHVTWDRYNVLFQHGAVAKQDADQQYTNYKSGVANVGSAQANISAAEQNAQANRANLDRLIVLQGYENVRAPFSGVITARNFDIGALVGGNGGTQGISTTPQGGTQNSGSAGNSGSTGTSSAASPTTGTVGSGSGELFREAQTGTLRILVDVPQESAPLVRTGQTATVLVQEFPNATFAGRVTRTSSSIDLNTRTLLTEVDVDNASRQLLPGMYAQVRIENVRANPPLLIPGDSVIDGTRGLQVAVVLAANSNPENQEQKQQSDQKKIHIVNVNVGRDYGAEIEVTSGLRGDEYVVVNPSDVVEEGALVKAVQVPSAQRNQPRRGPSERQPGGPSAPIPGKSDSGRGTSKEPGEKGRGSSK